MVERWCAATPNDFTFDVKLHQLFSFHSTPEAVAAGFAKPRGDGREREGQTNARDAGGAAKNFSACDRNLSQRWKNGRVASATFAGFFAAETRTERARTADRDAEWIRAGD